MIITTFIITLASLVHIAVSPDLLLPTSKLNWLDIVPKIKFEPRIIYFLFSHLRLTIRSQFISM